MKSKKSQKKKLNKLDVEIHLHRILGYAMILSILYSVSIFLGKSFELTLILLSYLLTRNVFVATFHFSKEIKCIIATIVTFSIMTFICVDKNISILMAILFGFSISMALFFIKTAVLYYCKYDLRTMSITQIVKLGKDKGLTIRETEILVGTYYFNYKGERLLNYLEDKGFIISMATLNRDRKEIKQKLK